jgi:hypothetical protein
MAQMGKPEKQPVFTVRLRAPLDRADAGAIRRLRRTVKHLLRAFGWRCLSIHPIDENPAAQPHGPATPRLDITGPDRSSIVDINSAFPSSFLKAADLPAGQDVRVTMDTVEVEAMPGDGEQRPVLRFVGKEKGLVLNRTNAETIANAFGPETLHWHGRQLLLFVASTSYNGRMVPCIRVRVASGQGTPAPAPTPATVPASAPAAVPALADPAAAAFAADNCDETVKLFPPSHRVPATAAFAADNCDLPF